MISLQTVPGGKYIELGGGSAPMIHPNVDARQCLDANGNPTVDFTADFNEPLPISTNEFDGVLSKFAIEHINWRKIPDFLKEVLRILKPGGKFACVTANTEAQIKWIQDHPEGWDNKDSFDSASCILFGDHDYKENGHAAFFSPAIAKQLFSRIGFVNIAVQPYGERNTDMVIEANKPDAEPKMISQHIDSARHSTVNTPNLTTDERASLFDKHYFNGGGKVGGYANEGYWDYPVHEITARHILTRKPISVLELGCGRGYIMKRIQDNGIRAAGMEISKHCYMTRVTEDFITWDLTNVPWPYEDKSFDLCVSTAVLEHIPEEFITKISAEMERVSCRGLHGIDLGHDDDGFDKTHATLQSKEWWQERLPQGHEIIDKEEMEKGEVPPEIFHGDGKIKLNVGSFINMFHNGWWNLDGLDMNQFAQAYRYNFKQVDVRQGLPFDTGSVSLIYASHFLEHLTYREGLAFLRECRRVIRGDGFMRLIVPDAKKLIQECLDDYAIARYNEISDTAAAEATSIGKLWELLFGGHKSAYDYHALAYYLSEAGFEPIPSAFRCCNLFQMKKETIDFLPCLSLYVDALPRT